MPDNTEPNAIEKIFKENSPETIATWRIDEDPSHYGPTGTFGFPKNRKDVDEAYIVTIESKALNRTIRALLQDDFSTSVQSTWANPTMTGFLTPVLQEVAQAATTIGVGSQFMTRRIWHNSTPMKLQLKLKFDSIVNAHNEVVVPCGTLQQMTLPGKVRYADRGEGTASTAKEFLEHVLIIPPGPNPFYVSSDAAARINEATGAPTGWMSRRQGDVIKINIGGLMSFENVILREVEVVWGRRFNKEGKPINATATVNFESFEIYTKEDINQELFKHNVV